MCKENIISDLLSEFAIAHETPEYIYIIDTAVFGEGKRSVTNDAVSILIYLSEHHNLKNRRLFYRDTYGNIDEILHSYVTFKGFAPGHSGISLPNH